MKRPDQSMTTPVQGLGPRPTESRAPSAPGPATSKNSTPASRSAGSPSMHQASGAEVRTASVRPLTEAAAPRRGPSGWIRDSLGDGSVAATVRGPIIYGSDIPKLSDTDPTTLAYRVAENFIDEGRRGMQRWMRPIAAPRALDVTSLTAPSNLEALGRLARDAIALIGTSATRNASLPTRARAVPQTEAVAEPQPRYGGEAPSSEHERPHTDDAQTTGVPSTKLVPPGQRDGRRRRRRDRDEPVTRLPTLVRPTDGRVPERRILPSSPKANSFSLRAPDASWGPIVKLL